MSGATESDAGLVSGLFNTSQQAGAAGGVALLSTVAAARTASLERAHQTAAVALTHGYQLAFLVGAGLTAGALCSLSQSCARVGRGGQPYPRGPRRSGPLVVVAGMAVRLAPFGQREQTCAERFERVGAQAFRQHRVDPSGRRTDHALGCPASLGGPDQPVVDRSTGRGAACTAISRLHSCASCW
jgi:hypothetical protein